MTSIGKNIYIISLADSSGRMQSLTIIATTKVLAETEACRICNVPTGTETATSQKSGHVDSETD